MNRSKLSKPVSPSGTPGEDIPEVLRDRTREPGKGTKRPLLWWGSASLALAAIALVLVNSPGRKPTPSVAIEQTPVVDMTPQIQPTQPQEEEEETTENVLGHLPYEQAPTESLKPVSADGRIRLREKAAERFLAMQAAARRDGVLLVPLSGFRTVGEQEYLFFEVKRQRNQDARQRAEVSAPPGHSEHHTGYAIDIGDARVPATNLLQAFEKTQAFIWLEKNAAQYSFELSFPPDNPQGIAYEPWHWRFVGDRHSLETFYRAQRLPQPRESE